MAAVPPKGVLRWVLRIPGYLYGWRCGWLLGHRFLLLSHVGRRTGRRYQTVLEIMEYRREGPEAIVMSGWGRGADWFRNLKFTADPTVTIGSRRFVATYRVLSEEEAMRVVAAYEHRNRFMAPVVRSVLSRLLGWRYQDSTTDRRRLVRQLPLIGFRPRS